MGGWGEVGLDLIQGTHIGRALKEHQLEKQNQRDQQAQVLGQQAQKIADNVVNQFGPMLDPGKELTIENLSQVPGAKPYIDQLQQITQQHNALFQPHEAPLLVRSIEKFFGRRPKVDNKAGSGDGDVIDTPLTTELGRPDLAINPDPGMTFGGATQEAQRQGQADLRRQLRNRNPNQISADTDLLLAPPPRSGAEDQEYLRKLTELKNDKTLTDDERLQYMTSLRANRYHVPASASREVAEHDIPGDAIYAHLDAKGNAIKDAYGNDIRKDWLYTQAADGQFYPKTTASAEKDKPYEPKFNSVTGTVYEISNGEKVYDASNIDTAPPEVQRQWKALKTDVSTATSARDTEEEKRYQQSLDKQQLGFDEREKLQKQAEGKQAYSHAQTAATRAHSWKSTATTAKTKLDTAKQKLSKTTSGWGAISSALPMTEARSEKEQLTNQITSLEQEYQTAQMNATAAAAAYQAAYDQAEAGGNTAGLPDPDSFREGGELPKPSGKSNDKDPLGIL